MAARSSASIRHEPQTNVDFADLAQKERPLTTRGGLPNETTSTAAFGSGGVPESNATTYPDPLRSPNLKRYNRRLGLMQA